LIYRDDLNNEKFVPEFFRRIESLGDRRKLTGGAQMQIMNYELIGQIRKPVKTFLFSELTAGARLSFATNQNRLDGIYDYHKDRIDGEYQYSEYSLKNWGLQLTIGAGF